LQGFYDYQKDPLFEEQKKSVAGFREAFNKQDYDGALTYVKKMNSDFEFTLIEHDVYKKLKNLDQENGSGSFRRDEDDLSGDVVLINQKKRNSDFDFSFTENGGSKKLLELDEDKDDGVKNKIKNIEQALFEQRRLWQEKKEKDQQNDMVSSFVTAAGSYLKIFFRTE